MPARTLLLIAAVIAADGLYKRDVFREPRAFSLLEGVLMMDSRVPGSLCCGYDRWRADQNDRRHQEDVESVLERQF